MQKYLNLKTLERTIFSSFRVWLRKTGTMFEFIKQDPVFPQIEERIDFFEDFVSVKGKHDR